jgi:hypothetical protein
MKLPMRARRYHRGASTLNRYRAAVAIILVGAVGFGCYLFFLDTLMFSEIVHPGSDPGARVIVNLFDFDTGLTRYDIRHLQSKAPAWSRRMDEIQKMQDERLQEEAHKELLAEMMEDPSMKKIARKILRLGEQSAVVFLEAIETFKVLGVF